MILTNKWNMPAPIVDAVANDEYSRGSADISVTQLISPARKVALLAAHDDLMTQDVSDRIPALYGTAIHMIFERAFLLGSGVAVSKLWDTGQVGDTDAHDMLDVLRSFVRAKQDSVTAEKRLYMKVGPYTISGAMDRTALLPNDDGTIVIEDYKTASVREMQHGVKVEREQQLNILRVLCEMNGYRVSGLRAVFILRDHSKVRADNARAVIRMGSGTQTDYPDSPGLVYPLPMWELEDAYRFIAERVQVHMQAQGAYAEALDFVDAANPQPPQATLPLCTNEERWCDESTFAVMKADNAIASRVCDTQADADAFVVAALDKLAEDAETWKVEHPRSKKTFEAPVFTVVERTGTSIHCAHYCPAGLNGICEQWKDIQLANA